ncbi:phage tail tape measure protein, TP901 family, core region [Mucilaginibacter lappiensis]|uniref:TP901 family phage tail tape measure protein n=1 Tax=Mucilaginibacter lappiensis TaxID=354630 RepID=A0ABR6PJB8_9SPHI|nr:phage tail tape measure protein [Mucilaginibacter lappiensis]MBB6109708.1 TP901 family phage tail tape measure protein [Mucilaginibacter lappiensis]SIR12647.1 phage tail tape measure protein, TP901 family, core region [Mucilaginibacter lappiensis]
MGGVKVTGGQGGGLNFTANLDINQALKDAKTLNKALADLTVTANGISKSSETQKTAAEGVTDAIKAQAAARTAQTAADGAAIKPLSEYQQKQLEIKQQLLDLAKDKAAQAAADKSASLALQDALKQERLAREQINTQIAAGRLAAQQAAQNPIKRVTDVSNSQAEIDAYNRSKNVINAYTTALNAETVARVKANAAAAAQAATTNNLSVAGSSYVSSVNSQTTATNTNVLSKKQLAQALAEEKYKQQQATAELKNNAREMLNAKGSLEQRKAALERLTIAYGRLSVAERESAAGARMANIIKGVRDQIKDLEDQTKSSRGGISGLFDSIKSSILGTLGPLALITAAWTALKAAFSHNVEISDNFVDVQRTAKLSADEVDRLGEQLKKINTRTPLEGLLDIGFIGGRLGVAKDDLVGFVQEVDELAVVLKKEFPGGADAVVTALGKIISVYKITQREGISLQDALRKVGSSILEVSHNGGATVQYLQEFSLKTASIAQVASISLPTILAYGAVLSKAGVQASTAATGVTRLISDLSTKRDKYFAIAQLADSTLTLEKFTKLINTDTKAALELFFRGLKAGNPTQTETADRLETLHLTAGRVKTTVISLAEAQEQLSEKTAIANKGYEDGTSVAHNFELANNSLAGSFDKLKNSIVNSFTNSSFSRRLAELLNGMTDNRTEAERLSDAYLNNKHSLDELESSLNPIVKRYDELKGKSKLSSIEQDELRKVTAQIGELLPGVTNAFDNYGNAIDINRGKVEQLTKAQRDLLELQNRDALKKATKQFNDAQAALPIAKSEAVNESSRPRDIIDKFQDLFGGDIKKQRVQATKDNITTLSAQAYEAAKAIRTLGGTLTQAQKDVINYYEVVNKPKPKVKQNATITGDGDSDADTPVTRTVDDIKADIKRVTELKKPLDVASKQYKDYVEQLKGFKKELKLANGGKDTEAIAAENQYKSALKSRNDLQSKIDELTKKGTDKQLTADEQEVESVRDRYKKMKEAAVAFNNDPENKKKGLRVDSGGLNRAQDNELVALRDKQDTEKLKVTLDSQKKLYDDYEAYKTKVGEDNAKKRYAGLIDTDKTYLQNLQAQEEALTDPEKSKGGADTDNAANKLKLELLKKEIAAEKLLIQKKNDDLYAEAYQAALTSSQALLAIESDYQNKVKALDKDATQEQIDNLKLQRDERIKRENEANAYAKGGYEKLMDHYDELTRGEILKRLELIKAGYQQQYKEGKLTADQLAKLMGDINSSINNIKGDNVFNRIKQAISDYRDQVKFTGKDSEGAKRKLLDLFSAISAGADGANQVIGALSSSFEQLGIGGQGLQDTLKNVQGMVSGLGTLAKGISTRNPIDIVTGSIGLLTSAISLFSHKDKDLQKKIDGYQKQLNALSQAYKQLDHDVASAVGESVYTDQEAQIKNLQAQQAKLTQMRDAEASKKRADQSKIDDYNNQIADIPNQIADINKSISQNLIQTTFKDLSKSLSDAFEEAFASGEDSAKKFEDVFNQVIVNAVKNSLQLKLLDPIINDFTNDLTEYAKQHDNSVVGFDFDTWKKAIQEKGELYTKGLEAIKDYLPDPNDTSSTAKGQIQASITEDTATRLYGVFAGTQTATLQVRDILSAQGKTIGDLYQTAQGNFAQLVKIEENTRRGADNTDGLIPALKEIINNTKGTSMRGAGLG